jgi:hypothetical protein
MLKSVFSIIASASFLMVSCIDDQSDASDPADSVELGGLAANQPDGTATRVPCTSTFGKQLSRGFGRLDGFLTSIVPAGTRGCNNDRRHDHLQIKMKNGTYDVAVNLGGFIDVVSLDGLIGGAWTEGWHRGVSLDYVSDLGVHSDSFQTMSSSAERTKINSLLANANHLSVFASGYGPTGAHLVHREGGSRDGLIVINPLSPQPTAIAFRFANDNF